MIETVNTSMGQYPIVIQRGVLLHAKEYMNLEHRRVCVVTDSGVPRAYVDAIAAACDESFVFCFESGERNKTFDTLKELFGQLLRHGFDRKDAIVAVGGGVVSDLAGFAAATYMRGIDFYNVPTTLLSQVDASVGGKTAVDFDGYKNMIGAFWQPKAVLIDPETLTTLPRRRISDGLAEVIKMALTSDRALFERLEALAPLPADPDAVGVLPQDVEDIIAAALRIKISVVEQDEREGGLRRVLNFGHTLGHAIESCSGLCERYHGECVAIGMIPMCSQKVRERLLCVLGRCRLPDHTKGLPDRAALLEALVHGKKAKGKTICSVLVDRVGEHRMVDLTAEQLLDRLQENK